MLQKQRYINTWPVSFLDMTSELAVVSDDFDGTIIMCKYINFHTGTKVNVLLEAQ